MTSECEYIGDLKFGRANLTGETTREDWLKNAVTEYAMSRFSLRILNMDDTELEAFANELGTTDEERGHAVVDLLEWFENWQERYKAGVDAIDGSMKRLMVIGERLIGRQEWYKH